MPHPSADGAARRLTLERLGSELAALAAAGDVEGARVLHEAIGRLLAAPAGNRGHDGHGSASAPVLPLRRRG